MCEDIELSVCEAAIDLMTSFLSRDVLTDEEVHSISELVFAVNKSVGHPVSFGEDPEHMWLIADATSVPATSEHCFNQVLLARWLLTFFVQPVPCVFCLCFFPLNHVLLPRADH